MAKLSGKAPHAVKLDAESDPFIDECTQPLVVPELLLDLGQVGLAHEL